MVAGLTLTLLAATVLAWSFALDRPPALTVANAMAGNAYYRVDFRDQAIGTLATTTRIDRHAITFESRFAVQMPGSAPIDVDETLEFASRPPFELRRATQTSGERKVAIEATSDGYQATVGGTGAIEQAPFALRYSLADYLELETWLRFDSPPVGAELVTETLDFDRLATTPKRYAVAETGSAEGATGYVVRSAELLEDKIVQLDRNLVADAFAIAGIVTLTRQATAPTLEPRTLTRAPQLRIALATAIDNPQMTTRLEIDIDAAAAHAFAQSPSATLSLHTHAGKPRLIVESARRRAVLEDEIEGALTATLNLPVGHPAIVAIADRVERPPTDRDLIAGLLRIVQGHLEYDEHTGSVDLVAAVRSGRGDCTEFADLFTTLARTLGIPARSITGLVYDDVAGPGFYLHAWSEVAIDGEWVGVDPTIGQMPIDATHIPFPDTDTGFLRAYAALTDMRFTIASASDSPLAPHRPRASVPPETRSPPAARGG